MYMQRVYELIRNGLADVCTCIDLTKSSHFWMAAYYTCTWKNTDNKHPCVIEVGFFKSRSCEDSIKQIKKYLSYKDVHCTLSL